MYITFKQIVMLTLKIPEIGTLPIVSQITQLRQPIVSGLFSKSLNSGNRLFLFCFPNLSTPATDCFCFVYPNLSTPATDCFGVPSNFPGTFRRLRNSSLRSSNSPRRFRKVAAENYQKTNVAFELKASVLFTLISQLRQPIVLGYPQIFLVLFGDCGTPPFGRQTVLVVSEK